MKKTRRKAMKSVTNKIRNAAVLALIAASAGSAASASDGARSPEEAVSKVVAAALAAAGQDGNGKGGICATLEKYVDVSFMTRIEVGTSSGDPGLWAQAVRAATDLLAAELPTELGRDFGGSAATLKFVNAG